MAENNWNLYRSQFPTRYWEQGKFDEELTLKLNRLILNQSLKKGLDVGCGTLGTLALKYFSIQNKIEVDMLDPYVDAKPDWMKNKVDWNVQEKYDVIVARGSINYLNEAQMKKLQSMLNPQGFLIANTFLTAPSSEWNEREAKNSLGEVGIERSRLVGNIVEHEIIFQNYSVQHTFFYYSEQDYQRIFQELTFETYARNSSLLIVKNSH